MNWIQTNKRLPKLKNGHSENVLAWTNKNNLRVMCLFLSEQKLVWGDCYGDINSESSVKIDEEVTHWMYLPKKPKL